VQEHNSVTFATGSAHRNEHNQVNSRDCVLVTLGNRLNYSVPVRATWMNEPMVVEGLGLPGP